MMRAELRALESKESLDGGDEYYSVSSPGLMPLFDPTSPSHLSVGCVTYRDIAFGRPA